MAGRNTVDVVFDVNLQAIFNSPNERVASRVDVAERTIQDIVDSMSPDGGTRTLLEFMHDDTDMEGRTDQLAGAFCVAAFQPMEQVKGLSEEQLLDEVDGIPEAAAKRISQINGANYDGYIFVKIGGGRISQRLNQKQRRSASNPFGRQSTKAEKDTKPVLNDRYLTEHTVHELQHAADSAQGINEYSELSDFIAVAAEKIDDNSQKICLLISLVNSAIHESRREQGRLLTIHQTAKILGRVMKFGTTGLFMASYYLDPGERSALKAEKRYSDQPVLIFDK